MAERRRQRLIDPETCTACYGCHEACPKGAVIVESRRVVIDPALCLLCGDCVEECSTGAIETLHWVAADQPWSVEEQLSWESLPLEEFSEPG